VLNDQSISDDFSLKDGYVDVSVSIDWSSHNGCLCDR